MAKKPRGAIPGQDDRCTPAPAVQPAGGRVVGGSMDAIPWKLARCSLVVLRPAPRPPAALGQPPAAPVAARGRPRTAAAAGFDLAGRGPAQCDSHAPGVPLADAERSRRRGDRGAAAPLARCSGDRRVSVVARRGGRYGRHRFGDEPSRPRRGLLTGHPRRHAAARRDEVVPPRVRHDRSPSGPRPPGPALSPTAAGVRGQPPEGRPVGRAVDPGVQGLREPEPASPGPRLRLVQLLRRRERLGSTGGWAGRSRA